MRSRILKPGFFKNEELARLSPFARLLYPGLWMLADREGRLVDRPARVRIEILPHDRAIEDEDVDRLLDELDTAGFIRRYVVDGLGYVAIPTFRDHQSPHFREPASKYPAPPSGKPQSGRGPASGETEARRGPASGRPLRSGNDPVSDPVPGKDPVSDPVSDPVPDPVPRNTRSGISPYVEIAREALKFVQEGATDDELVDTVQYVGRQRRIELTASQAREALAIALSQSAPNRG